MNGDFVVTKPNWTHKSTMERDDRNLFDTTFKTGTAEGGWNTKKELLSSLVTFLLCDPDWCTHLCRKM